MPGMKIKKITGKDFKSTRWSGGTTTELFLYPKSGDYAKRDFQVRISSATVELEKSVFTRLPGVQRWIMTLEGDIKLCHTGQYERLLKPFEIENFSGDWETISYGKAMDLNLMLHHGADGKMECLEIPAGERVALETDAEKWNAIVLFAAKGSLEIECEDKRERVFFFEAAVLQEPGTDSVEIRNAGEESARVVICSLALKTD